MNNWTVRKQAVETRACHFGGEATTQEEMGCCAGWFCDSLIVYCYILWIAIAWGLKQQLKIGNLTFKSAMAHVEEGVKFVKKLTWCTHFMQGRCCKKNDCTYVHHPGEVGQRVPDWEGMGYKVEYCQYYFGLNARPKYCRAGDRCQWAHSWQDKWKKGQQRKQRGRSSNNEAMVGTPVRRQGRVTFDFNTRLWEKEEDTQKHEECTTNYKRNTAICQSGLYFKYASVPLLMICAYMWK